MLCDNGQLVRPLQRSFSTNWRRVVSGKQYTTPSIYSPGADDEGGFYSSLDADSRQKSKFYVFTKEELRTIRR
jgi:uncharacterized protein YyaL (SSP411 family)